MVRNDLKVARSAIRCPFCHGDVEPSRHDWVVCRSCVARHHATCWEERDACSSCGERAHLVEARPSTYESDVKHLAVEAEIARLDREWGCRRIAYCRLSKSGALLEPAGSDATAAGIVASVAGCIVFVVLASGGGAVALLPLIVAVGAVVGAINAKVTFDSFANAEAHYKARRSELLLEVARITGRS
jgi:hypothetical protein